MDIDKTKLDENLTNFMLNSCLDSLKQIDALKKMLKIA